MSGPSTSHVGDESAVSLRQNVVKSYGISIDSSKIHEVAFEEQPETLRALGVNVFDQDVFEEGVLQQVDQAIAEQEKCLERERLGKELKTIEDEIRNVKQKLQRLKQPARELTLNDLERLKEQKDHILQKLQEFDKQKDLCQDEMETEHAVSDEISEGNSLDKVLHSETHQETEIERLVRLGEMTPFGSTVASSSVIETDQLKHADVDDTKHDGDTSSRTDLNLDDTGLSTDKDVLTSNFGSKTNIDPVIDSDEDYIPDEEELKLSFRNEEHVLLDEDSVEPIVDATIATKKTRSLKQKVAKKTNRVYHSVKDDGDDRTYQIRIREFKLKKSLREKGIEYEGQLDEEDEFWNEEGLDEEFNGGLKIPAVIWNKLFRYQKTGVKWLWELHTQQAGGIVGDEMGLGKTIQIIAFLAGLKYSKIGRRASKQNSLGPVLIICPATVLFQWVAELHKWWPEFRVAVLHDTGSYKGPKDTLITKIRNEPGILLTTYSGVRLNQDHLLQSRWDYIILDEGHIIRNPDAEVTLTCKQFRTPHRLVLSGSPMQNNLRELWSLFDFVYPGKLGTLPVFMQEFSVPITMGGYSNATPVQVQTAYKCACVLRDTINPYLLRRLKKDVKMKLNLPSKNEQVLFCRLTEEQTEIYKEYLASRDVSSILSGNMKVFPGLIMLRKICNHPDLTTEAGSLWKLRKDEAQRENAPDACDEIDGGYGHWKRAGKLVVVHSLLKLWKKQKHKVLLFTQTRQMLKILEIFVKSQGYNYRRMDGSTSIGSRQPLIEKFNEDKSIFVFLLTTRVGGLGVNLVGANRVIIYDPDWNPGTDMQAKERAWRVGQKSDVTIYRLLTTGTIEEKIYHRQIFKQFLTNRVLKDPKQRRFFKSNDLFELFTLDTSDNKESGTETGAIFAGLGCEVTVPRKPKEAKKKHVTDENVLKTIQERTKEILKAQFSKKQQKENTDVMGNKDEIIDSMATEETPKNQLSSSREQLIQNSDKTEMKSKADCSDDVIDTCERKDLVVNYGSDTSGLNRVSATISRPVSDTTSEIRSDGQILADETVKAGDFQESVSSRTQTFMEVSRSSGEDGSSKVGDGSVKERSRVKKEMKKKSKKRKRNKVEGIRIGQLSYSEAYDAKKGEVEQNADDDYILRKLFKKSGVHSAMKHDTIVNSGNADHVLVENEAKRVAAQAAEAVKRSRDQCMQLRHTGLPTWTGQSGVVGSPLGLQGRNLFGPKTKAPREEQSTTLFSGKSLIQKQGESNTSKVGNPMSSTQLLARMRARNSIGGTNAGSEVQTSEQKYVDTMTEVRNFIASGCSLPGRATTQEILVEFSTRLPTSDTAIFREMLRTICEFDRGSSGEGFWLLKPEFI